MLIRSWKHSLAAGLLVAGADGALVAQPPLMLPDAPTCQTAPPAGPGWTKAGPVARGSLLHPREFPTVPFGYSVAAHFRAHVNNGIASRMVLHDFDFVRGGDQLNYRGRERARQIAAWAANNPFPVVVEWLPAAPALAAARRAVVVAELTPVLGPSAADRVVIGPPLNVPLNGTEAELIYNNLLRLTDSAGTTPGTGVRGGASSGFALPGTSSFGTGGGSLGVPLGSPR